MKKTLSIISDRILKNEDYGCIINGELHVAPALFDKICHHNIIDDELLFQLTIFDLDEKIYVGNINELLIFSGQQVNVYDNGLYIGDATVTCYPYEMKFEKAEVTMHFPNNRQIRICPITSLKPILRSNYSKGNASNRK